MKQSAITRINGVDICTVEKDGQVFVPVKPICEAIGIAFERQYTKIKEDADLSSTVTLTVTVGADGKDREMVCLPLMYIYGWLFTINPKNVSADARPAVARYRMECYRALYEHFTSALNRQIDANNAEIEALKRVAEANERLESAKAEKRAADKMLADVRADRLNPQPTIF